MLFVAILCTLVQISTQAGFLLNTFNFPQPNNGAQQTTTVFQKPDFCHNLDCPEYEVLEKNDKFEVRRYKPSMWVATEIFSFFYTQKESTKMFFKLFHYISGNNTEGKKIAMTTPVVTEIVHGPGPDCESNFTMHFMIPFDLQNNTPQPTESGVFIKHFPEAIRYVKQYGGFTTDDKKRENLEELINDLNAAGKKYRDDRFFAMEYEGPYSINRHNELWVSAL